MLREALQRCLRRRDIIPSRGAKYTSHSLGIDRNTENVLLRIKLEGRLTRFGWVREVGIWLIYT